MRRLIFGGALALVVTMVVPSADASFPGSNGRIVFVRNRASPDIYTIAPDGRRLKTLTANRSFELSPRWSPGGKGSPSRATTMSMRSTSCVRRGAVW